MIASIRPRRAIILFVLLCSVGATASVWRVSGWGNELSAVDRFSEANALREVRNFRDLGLTHDYGLGRVFYPGMYPRDGFAAEAALSSTPIQGVTPDGVYTHYPPGPEYLLYAAEKLFGPEPVSRLRLLPIAIGWAATLFLGFAVRRRFGDGPAWLVMAACAATPVATDGFVGLHCQGYAAALMMIEARRRDRCGRLARAIRGARVSAGLVELRLRVPRHVRAFGSGTGHAADGPGV